MTTVIAMTVGHESTLLPGKVYGIAMKREKQKEIMHVNSQRATIEELVGRG